MRRTLGELMDLWLERYGRRLRLQTIISMVDKHLRPALGKLLSVALLSRWGRS